MRAIIAAGGTAGHINPGLAIADKIKEIFPESGILFIGTPDGMEAGLVREAGYDFTPIKMAGLQRKLTPNNLVRNAKAAYFYLGAGVKAREIYKKFKPDIVIGTGAYISMPVVKAAAKTGIKTINHESNSYPGVSTKLLSKYVDKIFTADEEAVTRIPYSGKCVITGNPLRNNLQFEDRETARRKLGLPEGLTVLSSGGSNGSNRITEAVIALLGWENEKGGINHIHSYGRNGKAVFEQMLKNSGVQPNPERTIIKEYISNMYTCLSAADLVISRSGSMSQTEIKAAGRASVQIPWPGAAENHQYFNALSMEKRGAAVLIEDKDLTSGILIKEIARLHGNPDKIREMGLRAKLMSADKAADKILGEIIDLLKT